MIRLPLSKMRSAVSSTRSVARNIADSALLASSRANADMIGEGVCEHPILSWRRGARITHAALANVNNQDELVLAVSSILGVVRASSAVVTVRMPEGSVGMCMVGPDVTYAETADILDVGTPSQRLSSHRESFLGIDVRGPVVDMMRRIIG
ncbi:MAG: hypothetical protein E6R04_05085 [Spirochaetes bacterium]|nr:MAG: hypothetical protein E6R04_05085 [Spirochaetota bacterium]